MSGWAHLVINKCMLFFYCSCKHMRLLTSFSYLTYLVSQTIFGKSAVFQILITFFSEHIQYTHIQRRL